MGLADNLVYFRKREGITQEQLAERLDVSRQTVSKWESAAAYPEMDKILQLCDLFSCSMDTLLRGDAEGICQEDTCHYDEHMTEFDRKITGGICAILAGVAVMLFLRAFGVSDGIATAMFLLIAMVGILTIVVAGLQHASYEAKHPYIQPFYSEAVLEEAERRFPIRVAAGIGIILAGVILLVACRDLTWPGEGFTSAIFFVFLAVGVPFLCYGGLEKGKYEVSEYNRMHNPDEKEKEAQRKIALLCGCTMLVATIVYLLLGFLKNLWAINWVVYVVGGILCGIETLIVNYQTEKEKNRFGKSDHTL